MYMKKIYKHAYIKEFHYHMDIIWNAPSELNNLATGE